MFILNIQQLNEICIQNYILIYYFDVIDFLLIVHWKLDK